MRYRFTLTAVTLLQLAISSAFAESYFIDRGHLKELSFATNGPSTRTLSTQRDFAFLFDVKSNKGASGFLLSTKDLKTEKTIAGESKGHDLWLLDAGGEERCVSDNVFRAKLSPSNGLLAYTTNKSELNVETNSGTKLITVRAAYDPSWKKDASEVVLSKAEENDQDLRHPNSLRVCILDVNTKNVISLTDGRYDDGQPEFFPSGRAVMFVSGARSGLASFWKVSVEGGQPVQLTNVSLTSITEKFVPTPYLKTAWSADGRWFLYDFKNGPVEETWGLEFVDGDRLVRALKIADGLFPQFLEDGKHFTVHKQSGDGAVPSIEVLP
jgi:Tol biopolymer transport system component